MKTHNIWRPDINDWGMERTRNFFTFFQQQITEDALEDVKQSLIAAGHHGEWALKHWMTQNTTWKGGRSANLKKPWRKFLSAFWMDKGNGVFEGGLYGAKYLGLGWGEFNIKPDLSTDTTGKNRQEVWVEVYKGKKELLPNAYIYQGKVMMRRRGRELVNSKIYQKSPTFESFLANAECNAFVRSQMLNAFQKEFDKRTKGEG